MFELALKLVLAHLAGDFLFQSSKWVEHKEKHKHKSRYLYLHIVVHALALLILLQFNLNYWAGILVILISHLFIDWCKLILHKKINSTTLFFADQFLHILVIAVVVYYYEPYNINLVSVYSTSFLLLITALLAITYTSSIVIKILISRWKFGEENVNDAGKYIGMMERLFIFFFIIFEYLEGIGFLLAAKSVFRFGDLTNPKERGLTEYILIGTFLSFGLAIGITLLYIHIKQIF